MNHKNKSKEIYTIGYSCFDLDSFLNAIKKHNITAIADVRSQPYSKFKSEFNKEILEGFLKRNEVAYVFLGDELGARIEEKECYVNGRVDFKLVSKSNKFLAGINRLNRGMENYRIALMCAEKDPLSCHRTLLICRYLSKNNTKVKHILFDGQIEEHVESDRRLLKMHKLDHPDMFKTEQERIDEAYGLQSQKIAYEETNNIDSDGDRE